jgi:hypothetical protein
MARDYLAIPATTTPSERTFSVAGRTITDNRGRLVSKTVRATMCLRSWLSGPLKDRLDDIEK